MADLAKRVCHVTRFFLPPCSSAGRESATEQSRDCAQGRNPVAATRPSVAPSRSVNNKTQPVHRNDSDDSTRLSSPPSLIAAGPSTRPLACHLLSARLPRIFVRVHICCFWLFSPFVEKFRQVSHPNRLFFDVCVLSERDSRVALEASGRFAKVCCRPGTFSSRTQLSPTIVRAGSIPSFLLPERCVHLKSGHH